MKTKLMMIGVVAAVAMGAMAEITNTVKVTKFHQSYPYAGKAMVQYMVGGTLPANAVAEITINTDDASATFTQRNIVTGANSHVIDFASSFGGALLLTNASFVVTISEAAELGGVQLWEGGPYWAECNVGATKIRLLLLVGRHGGVHPKRGNMDGWLLLFRRDMGVEYGSANE